MHDIKLPQSSCCASTRWSHQQPPETPHHAALARCRRRIMLRRRAPTCRRHATGQTLTAPTPTHRCVRVTTCRQRCAAMCNCPGVPSLLFQQLCTAQTWNVFGCTCFTLAQPQIAWTLPSRRCCMARWWAGQATPQTTLVSGHNLNCIKWPSLVVHSSMPHPRMAACLASFSVLQTGICRRMSTPKPPQRCCLLTRPAVPPAACSQQPHHRCHV